MNLENTGCSLFCPNCGKEIEDKNAIYCPYCAKSIIPPFREMIVGKHTGFPIAAGVLAIVAACISIFLGIVGIMIFAYWSGYYYYSGYYGMTNYWFVVMGVFGILAFGLGLSGGIFTLRRSQFALSIIGESLVLLSAFVTMISFVVAGYGAWITGLLFGLPAMILSILSIIFTGISKKEFS